MDCRIIAAVNFKTRLVFNQLDPIMTQEQTVLSKIVTLFSAEEIILQHSASAIELMPIFRNTNSQ